MIVKTIQKRIEELEKSRRQIVQAYYDSPEGHLRIAQTDKPQYFWVKKSGDTKGTYLKKKDYPTARMLAQKDYYEKLLIEIAIEIAQLQNFLDLYDRDRLSEFTQEMNIERRKLITPEYVTDQEYVDMWQSEEYQRNPYHREELIYETKRNELVRSKSEMLIADMYYEMGIPYKYEYPLTLAGGVVKYPDFVILLMPERRIIYHEHLGLLEDDGYREANLRKIREYEKNGIVLGLNLIITYETPYAPFDIAQIRKNIEKLIL